MKYLYIVTDIDGVWTDGGMYYDEKGNEFKKFNTRDGMGVELLNNEGIETIICTGENSNAVKTRAEKLKIKNVFIGIRNKKEFLSNFFKKNNIDLKTVAYLGDDVNDIDAMNMVELTGCPSDAMKKVKDQVDIVCCKKGGEGVFREFAELIMDKNNEK